MRKVLYATKRSPPLYFVAAPVPGSKPEYWVILSGGKPLPGLAEARRRAQSYPREARALVLVGSRLLGDRGSTRGRKTAH